MLIPSPTHSVCRSRLRAAPRGVYSDGCGVYSTHGCGVYSTRPVLALAAASQMGTPQEDESIFAILVAGETPNNLHQDKLGEYIR